MAIETDLSVAPYFDDTIHGLSQNYYKILFKPSLPVQVRELNELQSILQNQIEEFGDNILKKGTIIRGCSFSFYNNYPYVKIKDNQVDGAPVNPSEFLGKYLQSSSGHKAYVLDYADGFEQTDPDTKTLYIKYINSGYGAANDTFSSSDILTVTDTNYGIPNIDITTNGTGYSNSDSVVIVSAVAVTSVTGTITVGSTMQQPNTSANAVIVSVDTTTYPDKTILLVRPTTADLSDTTKSANAWTFSIGADYTIIDTSNASVTAIPVEIIGSGAVATVTTDSAQRVIDVSVLDPGSGYYTAPYATVRSFGGGTGVALAPRNYYSQLTVYNGANSVGSGYAFGVSEGIVYQKGYFLRVNPQTVVVSKYNQLPNNVSVGFRTDEQIVDAYIDTRLLDNALGSRNYTAPGADRLQLVPSLIVQDTNLARSNTEFFPLVEFSEGLPYKQNQRTAFNSINDELAVRTQEQTGDYVLDQFLVACKSTTNTSLLANTFTIYVDPGKAYISGQRIETYGAYQVTDTKGIDTEIKNSANVSLNYGSYVTVKELAGSFKFSTGDTVKLYDTARSYVSNAAAILAGTIAPTGNLIGTARIRSLQYIDTNPQGTPQGAPLSQYNMYLFDIQMNGGKAFKDVRSIYYDGATYDGIADVVLSDITPAGAANTVTGAVLKSTASSNGATLDKLLFYSGFDSPLSVNNISYTYRTFDDTGTNYTLGNNGIITIALSGNEYFPYSTELTSTQKSELIFYPLTNVYSNAYITGTVSSTLSSNVLTGSGTNFLGSLQIGDYVLVTGDGANPGSTVNNSLLRVKSITNATSMVVDGTTSFANSSARLFRAFPKGIPLPILTRSDVVVNTSIDSQTLNVDLNTRLYGSSNTIPLGVAFNISVNDAAVDTRKPNRNLFVKIAVGNNNTGFGYSGFGDSANGTFSSGNSTVTGVNFTNGFSNGDVVTITGSNVTFTSTINSITDSNTMTLSQTVNFSGAATIKKALNSNGPWCLGVADIFRLRGVYLANTSSVNTNSYDVTREFYIDHNQNPNFYGLGYLVKNKTSTLLLTPQDYLLVQFDAFTQDYEGRPVTINSYVRSTLANRANTDSLPLSSLTNDQYSLNTFEVPEVHSAGGTDYDLISYIDFRPRVANTANLATTAAGATINPAYAETFSSSNKKFPTPDSILKCDVEYFLGRVDSVYVDASGKIGVNKGHPTPLFTLKSSKVDDLVTPIKNKNVMVLNNIRIPPYPSIEENQNAQQLEILDKKIINDKILNRREEDKRIIRLFTENNISVEQPKGYTMEAIGNLERRIRDLEYYVALNNLELQIKDLNLPSSLSSNINRFKFGFFADSYDDGKFSEIDSQEYRAAIENGRVVPGYEAIKIVHPAPDCPYTHYPIVSQVKATGAAAPVICVNTAIIDRKEFNASQRGSSSATYDDDLYVTMASALGNNSGQVTVYCYFYSAADSLFIYQSNTANTFSATPILTTNNSVAFTNNDVSYLQTIPWFSGLSAANLKTHTKTASNPSYGLKYGGKITFNHNPAGGRYYKITTKKGPGSIVWRYRIEYPVNVDCAPSNPPSVNSVPASYIGKINLKSRHYNDRKIGWNFPLVQLLSTNGKGYRYAYDYIALNMHVTGLKPATLHKVYINKKDVTNFADTTHNWAYPPFTSAGLTAWALHNNVPFRPYTSASACYVMTNAKGHLHAHLYLVGNEYITPADFKKSLAAFTTSTGVPFVNNVDSMRVENPLLEVQSADGSSYAHKTIKASFTLFFTS